MRTLQNGTEVGEGEIPVAPEKYKCATLQMVLE